MRQAFVLALVACLSLILRPTAHADTITTFTLTSDTLRSGVIPGPSGHIVIDTTTGVILGGDLSVQDPPYFSYGNVPLNVLYQGTFAPGDGEAAESAFLQDANDDVQLALMFPLLANNTYPDLPSLIGYTGGPLCGQFVNACYSSANASFVYAYYTPTPPFGPGGVDEFIFLDGELTPETTITSTPEPSTLVMLTTGMLSFAGLLRKRLTSS